MVFRREVIMNFLENLFGNKIESISATKIDELLANGEYILDVRTKEEIEEKSIEGTHNIVLDELSDRYREIPNKKIYVLCRSGRRSLMAAKFLKSKGYEAVNLSGGILEYFQNK